MDASERQTARLARKFLGRGLYWLAFENSWAWEKNVASQSSGAGNWRQPRDRARNRDAAGAGWRASGYRVSFEQGGCATNFATNPGGGRGMRRGGDGYFRSGARGAIGEDGGGAFWAAGHRSK